jgi:site-specific DNA-methyltransferase (adenine-specific)
MNDDIKSQTYLEWCERWLEECVRVLKPGGSLFLWNLPKWNAELAAFLGTKLSFRNWVATSIKYRMPIANRLYPAHYSLLYFVNGDKPSAFGPDRLPMEVCKKCFADIKDYGGYKSKMNPAGINLSDVWTDIPPVRHSKYKRRQGSNELSLKLMDRVLRIGSKEGDTVLDPFGGSGTTFMAAELLGRKWLGCELGPPDVIQERFARIDSEREILADYRSVTNRLFTEDVSAQRKKRGLWTHESFNSNDETQMELLNPSDDNGVMHD